MSLVRSAGPIEQPKSVSTWLAGEGNPEFTRRVRTMLAGDGAARVFTSGMVVAALTLDPEVTVAVKSGGNTGDGTLTMDATHPLRAGAKKGKYTVRCIATASNSGTFLLKDPDGFEIETFVVGATVDNDLKFVVADVGDDFAVGDGWDLTVDPGSLKYVRLDPVGEDGSQIAAGISLFAVEAPEDVDTDFIVIEAGPTLVHLDELAWPDGITADQRATAEGQLERLGIRGTPGTA